MKSIILFILIDINSIIIEHKDGKGSLEERIRHHQLCRTGAGPNGPEYVECSKEWFWNN